MFERELKKKDISGKRDGESSNFDKDIVQSSKFLSESVEDDSLDSDLHITQGSNTNKSLFEAFKSIVTTILMVLIVVIPIRMYIGKPFLVNGSSMDPSFETWDYLIVDVFTYKFLHDPQRGDVIVFKAPIANNKFFIKRIIALPGETIDIKNGKVTIYNDSHPEGMLLEEPYVSEANQAHNSLKMSMGHDEYFVMGDNRAGSFDSRFWGPLKKDNIVGRAFLRLYPLNEVGFFPAAADLSR